jgi:hypothetical protein
MCRLAALSGKEHFSSNPTADSANPTADPTMVGCVWPASCGDHQLPARTNEGATGRKASRGPSRRIRSSPVAPPLRARRHPTTLVEGRHDPRSAKSDAPMAAHHGDQRR